MIFIWFAGEGIASPTGRDIDDGDIPLPSHIVRDQINVSDLREATGVDSISDWARKNVGDTHLGKRKCRIKNTD